MCIVEAEKVDYRGSLITWGSSVPSRSRLGAGVSRPPTRICEAPAHNERGLVSICGD